MSLPFFVRYISDKQNDDGSSKELCWIEEHYEEIVALLKSFHEDNEILFIANEGIQSSKITIHSVQKDKGDTVNRRPISTTPTLLELFHSFEFPQRQDNLIRYKKKKYSRMVNKVKKRIVPRVQKLFLHKCIHERQY